LSKIARNFGGEQATRTLVSTEGNSGLAGRMGGLLPMLSGNYQ